MQHGCRQMACSAPVRNLASMDEAILFRHCQLSKVVPLRHAVLRPGKPVETAHFQEDKNPRSFHVCAEKDQQVIAVASLYREDHPLIKGSEVWRLRGMAVHASMQGRGIGARLLHFAEGELSRMHCDTVWCNARERAASFYRRNNWQVIGKPFDIPEIGLHFVMFKNILVI